MEAALGRSGWQRALGRSRPGRFQRQGRHLPLRRKRAKGAEPCGLHVLGDVLRPLVLHCFRD